MKRTLSKMLGIAALALAAVGGSFITASPAQAQVVETPYTQNGISCLKRTGGNYPDNGNYYYCGDPNLPINITSHKTGYVTNIQNTVPAHTRTAMANALLTNGNPGAVQLLVFCTKWEAETFFATPFTGISDQETAIFNKPTNQIMVFQWLTSNNLGCNAPLAQRTAAYTRAYQAMDHEIGHFVDWRKNVPAGQVRHSVDISTKLYRKYLQKDIDWINSTTRAGAFVPCTNIFTNTTRDKFLALDGTFKQVCNGTTRNAELNGLATFDIMKKMMPYFVTTYTTLDVETGLSNTSWRELFAETFNKAIGTTSSQASTSATAYYLFGSFFLCSTRYIEIYAKNGNAPQPADLASPWNRCVLP